MQDNPLPLRDLQLPEPVSWWPLAPGWWVVLVLLVIALVWVLSRALKRYRQNAARRYALSELSRIEADFKQHGNVVILSKSVSALLRRAMLAYAPRAEVAGLTGAEWLEWLDRDLPVPYFHTDGGKSLLEIPYRNPEAKFADVDIGAMLSAVRMRIETPTGAAQ